MTIANRKETINADIEKVWKLVTDLRDCSWRSDLCKIEVIEEGKKFVEYTKEGYATTFTITAAEPLQRYEFDMENDNMKGRWTGLFQREGQGTTLDSTEDVTVKKAVMKPFAAMYLKKQQKRYFEDLKRALEL